MMTNFIMSLSSSGPCFGRGFPVQLPADVIIIGVPINNRKLFYCSTSQSAVIIARRSARGSAAYFLRHRSALRLMRARSL